MIIAIQDITLDLAGSPIDLKWTEDRSVPQTQVAPGGEKAPVVEVAEWGNVLLVEDRDGSTWEPLKKAQ